MYSSVKYLNSFANVISPNILDILNIRCSKAVYEKGYASLSIHQSHGSIKLFTMSVQIILLEPLLKRKT